MGRSTPLKLFGFCLLLLVIRVLKTGHFSFFFLLWNLFLAWIPYAFISKYDKAKGSFARLAVIGCTILFLPNAPYILTDLFHLTKHLVAPRWFDLVLILSFSLLGLILFLLAAEHLFAVMKPYFRSQLLFLLVKCLLILSNGYGIYIGRYLRLNSWEVLSDPDHTFRQMYHSLFRFPDCKETMAATFTFSIFLYLVVEIYESFQKRISAQNELL